jgi:hypothetical protein
MEFLIGVLGGVLGAVAGGVIAWWTTKSRLRTELQYGYDKELRSERIAAYRTLWRITASLPRYWWPSKPARSDLRRVIEECHSWYFEGGGLIFSPETKTAYLNMMDRLDEAAGRAVDDSSPVPDSGLASLFDAAEHLRVQLAVDVGAGHRPELPSRPLPPAEERLRLDRPSRQLPPAEERLRLDR